MYRGQSIGRLIDFLGHYWTVTKAHEVIFMGNKTIRERHETGPVVGSYSWDANTDIPTFAFAEKFEYLNKQQADKKQYYLQTFGYLELDPEDEYVGTTSKYLKLIRGEFTSDIDAERLEQAKVLAYERARPFRERMKQANFCSNYGTDQPIGKSHESKT